MLNEIPGFLVIKAKSMLSIYIHHYIKIIIKAGNGDCIQCIYRKLIFSFALTNSRKQTLFKHQLPILKGPEKSCRNI